MQNILLAIVILLFTNCKSKVYVEVKEFVGQKIEMPTIFQGRILDRDTTLIISADKPCLVVYYNF